jgi:predicted Kef-type K+ transport protein
MGEFSFVLGAAGLATGAINPEQFTAILLAVLLSIIASSVLVRLSVYKTDLTRKNI